MGEMPKRSRFMVRMDIVVDAVSLEHAAEIAEHAQSHLSDGQQREADLIPDKDSYNSEALMWEVVIEHKHTEKSNGDDEHTVIRRSGTWHLSRDDAMRYASMMTAGRGPHGKIVVSTESSDVAKD